MADVRRKHHLNYATAVVGWLKELPATIRGKILLAFCLIATFTAALGIIGTNSVDDAGRLVVDTYDKSLMSISYARLASGNFTAMELAWAKLQRAQDEEKRSALRQRIDDLASAATDDLEVAEARALSDQAAQSARGVLLAVGAWNNHRKAYENTPSAQLLGELDNRAREITQKFDELVEQTADDGFYRREQALEAIKRYHDATIIYTFMALCLGAAVATLLTRQMIRPIGAALQAANRISAGELDVPIQSFSKDELGGLLNSLANMRDKIREMMEREITARRSAQMRLMNAIECSSEAVILVDDRSRIVISNAQALKFFPEISDGLGPGAPWPKKLDGMLNERDGELKTTTGRWVRISQTTLADGGHVVIASDITAIRDREFALIAAKEQAEAASRAKTEFLANMSHELRTPLNAVIGFAEVIRDASMGPHDPRYRGYAGDICNAGRHLLSVINDVLDLSKIEFGNLDLAEEDTELGGLIQSCADIVRERARSARIVLSFPERHSGQIVRVDPRRLKQILINLLSNAIKFTPEGGRVSVSNGISREGHVEISVADTGIGMSPDEIGIALEPFRQVDSSLSRKFEGTGLGLPLAQRLAQMHGGSLRIESTVKVGTIVTIVLPPTRRIGRTAYA